MSYSTSNGDDRELGETRGRSGLPQTWTEPNLCPQRETVAKGKVTSEEPDRPNRRNYLGRFLQHPKKWGKNDCDTLSETGQRAALIAHPNPDPKGQAEGSGHGQIL